MPKSWPCSRTDGVTLALAGDVMLGRLVNAPVSEPGREVKAGSAAALYMCYMCSVARRTGKEARHG